MNKPRLIDANELKNIIDGSEEFIDWQKREICECIDCCDTAYDIDKIVEQLDDLEIANVYDYYERMYFDYISLDEAIKVVKGGADNG